MTRRLSRRGRTCYLQRHVPPWVESRACARRARDAGNPWDKTKKRQVEALYPIQIKCVR
ncbi:hypothetical protein [Luteimonas chenhongjianii]|uniref:hypothetical protein n=1 Tax=Luteimonas chenhongjianii TaxID=2006110 RepID=UPI0012FE00D6|nr:hypothetical protein [Luteimonas chenhongjianii]